MLSGITTANTPPKNSHAASNPAITLSVVWVKVSHTKQWRLRAGREDQRMADPAPSGVRVEHQAHAPEVDLELVARLAVGDPHRRAAAPARPAQLGAVALEGARRHADPPARQQGVDLDDGQPSHVDPGAGSGFWWASKPTPRLAVAVDAMRPDPLDHQRNEHVAQLVVAAVAVEAELARGLHVAADGLAVEPTSRSIARRPSPASQSRSTSRTSNTRTSLNPIAAPRSADRWRRVDRISGPTLVDPRGGPITGGRVVPCSWRNSAQGGPMSVAGDSEARSRSPRWGGAIRREPLVMTAWLTFGLAGLALTVAGVSLGLTVYQLRRQRDSDTRDS